MAKHHWQHVPTKSPETAEELWEAAKQYFKWCDENPLIRKSKTKTGKEAGMTIEEDKTRPYSLKALCLHCGVFEQYFRDLRMMAEDNIYFIVASRIMYIIYTQNLELAMIGEYSPVFAAKLLGIGEASIDKTDGRVKIEIVDSKFQLSENENQILESIEEELYGAEIPIEQFGKS